MLDKIIQKKKNFIPTQGEINEEIKLSKRKCNKYLSSSFSHSGSSLLFLTGWENHRDG